MKTVCYLAIPFVKEEVTLALESGVMCLIVPDESVELAQGLARCDIIPQSRTAAVTLTAKADEEKALNLLTDGLITILEKGWEIIPVENLLAHEERLLKSHERSQMTSRQSTTDASEPTINQKNTPKSTSHKTLQSASNTEKASPNGSPNALPNDAFKDASLPSDKSLQSQTGQLALEVRTAEEAQLASKILERGVNLLVVTAQGLPHMSAILETVNNTVDSFALQQGVITSITPVGIGHRVCVDTLSLLATGQGMLVGNSAGFTFLVNAETERNEYVASRPFRINAGAVHSYCMMPADTTAYLEELQAGREVLIVDKNGKTSTAVIGRCKVERRPMLHITAQIGERQGSVFLQNAETIRLVQPDGTPTSVVNLSVGDSILCHLDTAGRHFGMRISEDIAED